MKDIFSPTEIKVWKAIGKKRIGYGAIAMKSHGKDTHNTRAGVSMMIKRINTKCKWYKLDWCIDGEGVGKQGRTVWVDKR